jgi:hypothetical protein
MSKLKNYLIISATVFAVVALAHLVRAIEQWPIVIASWSVPLGVSWLGAIAAGALSGWAILLLRER